ncbi:MAG: outer membrane beta-barrel protein [Aquidulcibacter sp.]|jgi:opacity protein-like surface antigen|uniref:outer membrane protein n=1 Tax=Aquidulcibacter sp. TaxID=2052990 RepID=UPI0022BB7026|nr:outer membrane beta-barrel protein [Aquidulcibacter sp.]
MFYRTLAVVAALFAFGNSAIAQTADKESGLYAKVYGGSSTLSNTDLQIGGTRTKGKFGGGALAGGAIGYDYAGPWRSELEYTYRSSSLNSLGGVAANNSDYASTSIMVNGLYTFNEAGGFKPYVGLGIGLTREVDFDLNAGPTANRGQYSRASMFAVQGIAGVEYEFASDWRGFGELRTFSVNSPSLKGGGRTLKADYRTTDIVIGIARKF